jgi:hypothetical protein
VKPAHLDIKVFPNPSSGHFSIQLGKGSGSQVGIRVYDIFGRIRDDFKAAPGASIEIGDNYKPGVYYLEVIQDKQKQILMLIKTGHR